MDNLMSCHHTCQNISALNKNSLVLSNNPITNGRNPTGNSLSYNFQATITKANRLSFSSSAIAWEGNQFHIIQQLARPVLRKLLLASSLWLGPWPSRMWVCRPQQHASTRALCATSSSRLYDWANQINPIISILHGQIITTTIKRARGWWSNTS